MSDKHLSLEERYYLEIEYKKGTSQKDIAKALRRDQGNISRELGRIKGLKVIDTNKPILSPKNAIEQRLKRRN